MAPFSCAVKPRIGECLLRFFTENWGSKQGLRRSAKKAARGRSMKARPTQSRRGVKGGLRPFSSAPCRVKGGLRPFSSVPCGVWGNAPTVSRETSISNALNKGAGSEASLPLTLRVRRRAPKLLFPQESVKNLFFGIRRFVSGIRKRADLSISSLRGAIQI